MHSPQSSAVLASNRCPKAAAAQSISEARCEQIEPRVFLSGDTPPILNIAPAYGGATQTIDEGSPYWLALTATDPDPGTLHWTVQWGDGTTTTDFVGSTLSHAYAGTGLFNISASAVDEFSPPGTCYVANTLSLDIGFGSGGVVLANLSETPGTIDIAHGVALDAQGRIYLVGESANMLTLSRFTADGVLDTSFNAVGFVRNQASSGTAVAVADDAKVLVAGGNVLARYNSDGSVDTTFSGGQVALPGSVKALALDATGRAVVAVTTANGIALARYDSQGSADATFNGDGNSDGIIAVPQLGQACAVFIDRLDPQGRILLAGAKLLRFSASGVFDQTLGGPGGVSLPGVAYDVAVQDGKPLVAGNVGNDFYVARYDEAGLPDSTFAGGSGVNQFHFSQLAGAGSTDRAFSLTLAPDGKIVVCGAKEMWWHPYYMKAYIAIARLTADGLLDASFNGNGQVLLNDGYPYSLIIDGWHDFKLRIADDGRYIVAGSVAVPGYLDVGLLKYGFLQVVNVAPTADFAVTSVADEGTVTVEFSNPYDPSAADVQGGWTYSVDFDGDGLFTGPGEAPGPTVQRSHTYATSGVHTIRGRITDSRGAFSDYFANVITSTLVAMDDEYGIVHDRGPLVADASHGVLGNDLGVASGAQAHVLSNVSVGTLDLQADGGFTYTPPTHFVGDVSFTYYFQSPLGPESVPALVVLHVTNAAPHAADETDPQSGAPLYSTPHNAPLAINPLANDSDADGDALSMTVVVGPSHGSLSPDGAGGWIYTPHGGYAGPDVFVYRADDGVSNSQLAVVPIAITNALPNAIDDLADAGTPQSPRAPYIVHHGGTLVVAAADGLAWNDGHDAEGVAIYQLVSGPRHGALTLGADGSFTYVSQVDTGDRADSFTYRIFDAVGYSSVASVQIAVTNDTPQAMDDAVHVDGRPMDYRVAHGATLNVSIASGLLANDADMDQATLCVAATTPAAHGSVTVNPDGSFTYTADADYVGPDSFTYRLTDGLLQSNVAVAYLEVTNVAPTALDEPVAVDPEGPQRAPYRTSWNRTLAIDASSGLLWRYEFVDGAFRDANNDAVTIEWYSQPAYGNLTVNAEGSFQYVPQAGFVGPDAFLYQLSDGVSLSAIGKVNLQVANDVPVAHDIDWPAYAPDKPAYQLPYSSGPATWNRILGSLVDADGDALSVCLVTEPGLGSLTINADSSFTYTPSGSGVGVDTFAYRIFDGLSYSNVALVRVRVTDAPPVAHDAAFTAAQGQLLVQTIPIDWGQSPALDTVQIIQAPQHGLLEHFAITDAQAVFAYRSLGDFVGEDSFVYKVSGPFGESLASVRVRVTGQPLIAAGAAYQVLHDHALQVPGDPNVANSLLAIQMLAADTFGSWRTDTTFSLPSGYTRAQHGDVTMTLGGGFTYTPDAGFVGRDEFTFFLNSPLLGASEMATVTVDVYNTPPQADHDSQYGGTSNPFQYTFAHWANVDHKLHVPAGALSLPEPPAYPGGLQVYPYGPGDFDADGDAFTYSLLGQASHGTVQMNSDGSFTYMPAGGDFRGIDRFTYRTFDSIEYSNAATVEIDVYPSPACDLIARNDVVIGDWFDPVNVFPLGNDTGAAVIATYTQPAQGTLTEILDGEGNLTGLRYSPPTTPEGDDSFTYTATVANMTSNVATVTIDQDDSYDLNSPYAFTASNAFATPRDTPVVVLRQSDLREGDSVTFATAADGTITQAVQGGQTVWLFTPESGFAGMTDLSFTVHYSGWRWEWVGPPMFWDSVEYPATSAPNRISVNVTDQLAQPIDRQVTLPHDQSRDVDLLENVALDAEGDERTIEIVREPEHGTLTAVNDRVYTYAPAEGYFGEDWFSYRITGHGGISTTAVVWLTVTSDLIMAHDDLYTALHDEPFQASWAEGVLKNDVGVSELLRKDHLDVRVVLADANYPMHGTLVLDGSGALVYTPQPGWTGQDCFPYRIDDGTMWTYPVNWVRINVTDQSPSAVTDKYTVVHDRPLVIAPDAGVLANDTDADPHDDRSRLSATLVPSALTQGTVRLSQSGAFLYTPPEHYVGADFFLYQAGDGALNGAIGVVEIQLTDASPLCSRDTYTVPHGGELVIDLAGGALANDSDADGAMHAIQMAEGDLLEAALVGPDNGRLTLSASGAMSYLAPSTAMTDIYTYRVSDGASLSPGLCTITFNVTNIAPAANDDAYRLTKNSTLLTSPADGLLVNDRDADASAPLTVRIVAQPRHGTLELYDGGCFRYVPDANFIGDDAFTYVVGDGQAEGNVARVLLHVTDAAPATFGDLYEIEQGSALVLQSTRGPLANDSDADDEFMSLQIVNPPQHGTITHDRVSGALVYTPSNAAFAGYDALTYQARGADNPDAAMSPITKVTIHVTPQSAAQALSRTYAVLAENTLLVPAGLGLLWGSALPAAGERSWTVEILNAPLGTLEACDGGAFKYVPPDGFVGADAFTYRLWTRPLGEPQAPPTYSDIATVHVDVVNNAPTAADTHYTVDRTDVLAVPPSDGLLTDAVSDDGRRLSVTLLTDAQHGQLDLSPSGSLVYVPHGDFAGTDVFAYVIQDGLSVSNIAWARIDIANAAPQARRDDYSVLHGAYGRTFTDTASVYDVSGPDYDLLRQAMLVVPQAGGLLANDTDIDGDLPTVEVVNSPGHASSFAYDSRTGSFSYRPQQGFTGTDCFAYRVSDGLSHSRIVKVVIEIRDTPPTAYDDAYVLDRDRTLVVGVTGGLLANDGDGENDPLTVTAVTMPSHGLLTWDAMGAFCYTPSASYVGEDSFTYEVSDGNGVAQATVRLTVDGSAVLPVAVGVPDTYDAVHDSPLIVHPADGVLANDLSTNNYPLTVLSTTYFGAGSLTMGANGGFVFTPGVGEGVETFTYTPGNGFAVGEPVTVTVRVINRTPRAFGDSYTVTAGRSLIVGAFEGLLANDFDEDGDALSVDIVPAAAPAHGTLTMADDGSFVYQPAAGYVGDDAFEYTISDGARTATGAVAITVTNQPPAAQNDFYSTHHDAPLIVIRESGLLANDSDADAQTLRVSVAAGNGPSHGTLQWQGEQSGWPASGCFVYRPSPGFVGVDSFTYTVSDGFSQADAVATIAVVDTVPVAADASFTVHHDRPLQVGGQGLLAGLTDAEGDILSVVIDSCINGSVEILANGSFIFTPAQGFAGIAAFAYHLTDGLLNSNQATVTIEVLNNLEAVDNTYVLPWGRQFFVDASRGVLANDRGLSAVSDDHPEVWPVGQGESLLESRLTATLVGDVSHGTLTLRENGAFLYVPQANYVGPDSFTYCVTDGLLTRIATVTLVVDNHAPNISNDGETYHLASGQGLLVAAIAQSPLAMAQPPSAPSDAAFGGAALWSGATSNRLLTDNDTDDENDRLTVELVSTTQHGTLTLKPNGSFSYVPDDGYCGGDSFEYRLSDSLAVSPPARVDLVITNAAPLVAADTYAIGHNGHLYVSADAGLLANDIPFREGELLTVQSVTDAGGRVHWDASGALEFTPDATSLAPYTFSYVAVDQHGIVALPATVTISVTNASPVQWPDVDAPDRLNHYYVAQGATLDTQAAGLCPVLADDADADGDAITAALVTSIAQDDGTLQLRPDGHFTFTPAASHSVPYTASFIYAACDALTPIDQRSVQTVTITVLPPQRTPAGSELEGDIPAAPQDNDVFMVDQANAAETCKVLSLQAQIDYAHQRAQLDAQQMPARWNAQRTLDDLARDAVIAKAATTRTKLLELLGQLLAADDDALAIKWTQSQLLAQDKQAATVTRWQADSLAQSQYQAAFFAKSLAAQTEMDAALADRLRQVSQADADHAAASRADMLAVRQGADQQREAYMIAEAILADALQAQTVAQLDQYRQNLATAASQRDVLLRQAMTILRAARDNAQDDLAAAYCDALNEFNTDIATPRTTRDAALGAAQADFQQSVNSAYAAYLSAGADYATTPPLDLCGDVQYQLDLAAALSLYSGNVADARDDYQQLVDSALAELSTALNAGRTAAYSSSLAAMDEYQYSLDAARDTYAASLLGMLHEHQARLDLANAQYDAQLAAAQATLEGAVLAADMAQDSALKQAADTCQSALAAATHDFDAGRTTAMESFEDSLEQAVSEYRLDMAAVTTQYDNDAADATSEYADAALAADLAMLANAQAAMAQERLATRAAWAQEQSIVWGALGQRAQAYRQTVATCATQIMDREDLFHANQAQLLATKQADFADAFADLNGAVFDANRQLLIGYLYAEDFLTEQGKTDYRLARQKDFKISYAQAQRDCALAQLDSAADCLQATTPLLIAKAADMDRYRADLQVGLGAADADFAQTSALAARDCQAAKTQAWADLSVLITGYAADHTIALSQETADWRSQLSAARETFVVDRAAADASLDAKHSAAGRQFDQDVASANEALSTDIADAQEDLANQQAGQQATLLGAIVTAQSAHAQAVADATAGHVSAFAGAQAYWNTALADADAQFAIATQQAHVDLANALATARATQVDSAAFAAADFAAFQAAAAQGCFANKLITLDEATQYQILANDATAAGRQAVNAWADANLSSHWAAFVRSQWSSLVTRTASQSDAQRRLAEKWADTSQAFVSAESLALYVYQSALASDFAGMLDDASTSRQAWLNYKAGVQDANAAFAGQLNVMQLQYTTAKADAAADLESAFAAAIAAQQPLVVQHDQAWQTAVNAANREHLAADAETMCGLVLATDTDTAAYTDALIAARQACMQQAARDTTTHELIAIAADHAATASCWNDLRIYLQAEATAEKTALLAIAEGKLAYIDAIAAAQTTFLDQLRTLYLTQGRLEEKQAACQGAYELVRVQAARARTNAWLNAYIAQLQALPASAAAFADIGPVSIGQQSTFSKITSFITAYVSASMDFISSGVSIFMPKIATNWRIPGLRSIAYAQLHVDVQSDAYMAGWWTYAAVDTALTIVTSLVNPAAGVMQGVIKGARYYFMIKGLIYGIESTARIAKGEAAWTDYANVGLLVLQGLAAAGRVGALAGKCFVAGTQVVIATEDGMILEATVAHRQGADGQQYTLITIGAVCMVIAAGGYRILRRRGKGRKGSFGLTADGQLDASSVYAPRPEDFETPWLPLPEWAFDNGFALQPATHY